VGGGAERRGAAGRPDLYLEVDARTAARRRQGRGGTAELFDADEVQRAVARAYGRVVRKHARAQHVERVEGRASPDEVAREILLRVRAVLPRRRRK
jgi:dTMP kinase